MWSQTNSFFSRSKNRVDYSFSIVNRGYLSIFIKQSQNKGLFFFFDQKQVLFRKNKYTDLLLLYHLHFLIQKYVFFPVLHTKKQLYLSIFFSFKSKTTRLSRFPAKKWFVSVAARVRWIMERKCFWREKAMAWRGWLLLLNYGGT